MYVGLDVKDAYSGQILTNLEFSRQIFEKSLNVKFHENPSSGSLVVPCGRTDGRTDRQTDMTKPIVGCCFFMTFFPASSYSLPLGPNIILRTLVSNIFRLCSSLHSVF
jgi:hypothetical protein